MAPDFPGDDVMNPLSRLRSYLELDVTPDLDGEAATRRSTPPAA